MSILGRGGGGGGGCDAAFLKVVHFLKRVVPFAQREEENEIWLREMY